MDFPTKELTSTSGRKATLYNGDCVKVFDELKLGQPGSKHPKIDAIITDPPYLMPDMGGGGCFSDRKIYKEGDERGLDKILDHYDIEACMDRWDRSGAMNLISFCSTQQVEDTIREMEKRNFMTTVCGWEKSNPMPFTNNTWVPSLEYYIHGRKKGAYFNNDVPYDWKRRIQFMPREEERHWHPTPKPVKLMFQLIEILCPPGGVVADFFSGSGTCGIATLNSGRDFIGMEMNEDHFPKMVDEIKRAACQKKMPGFGG